VNASNETKPFADDEQALYEIIEALRSFDEETRFRILRTVAVFYGMRRRDGEGDVVVSAVATEGGGT
jgi:hypothetical protein